MSKAGRTQEIDRYYDHFRRMQITFSPDMARDTGLVPEEVHLKCDQRRIHCTIQSISMADAVLLVSPGQPLSTSLRTPKSIVALRMAFTDEEGRTVPFFIQGKLQKTILEPGSRLRPVTMSFLQKPPDFFILTLGKVIEANLASERRKEERVLINEITGKALGLAAADQWATAGTTRRSCIIRDLSFSGATIVLQAAEAFQPGGRITLEIRLQGTVLQIPAGVLRAENVLGRTGFQVLGLRFNEGEVPVGYKTRLTRLLKMYGTGGNQALFEQEKTADALVRTGVISREKAEEVLRRQRAGDRRSFGHIAIELQLIDDGALFRYIADLQ